jgi:hypothetical protein
MLIEQPVEWNKYLDEPTLLTWATRWKIYKLVLPVCVPMSVLFMGIAAVNLWLADYSFRASLPKILMFGFVIFAVYFAAAEFRLRFGRRAKRTLKLDAKRVTLHPARYGRIPWEQVSAWLLESVPVNGLRKLTFEYYHNRKTRYPYLWSIILKHPEQTQTFRSTLEELHQAGKSPAPIIELSQPMPKPENPTLCGLWTITTAFSLFTAGFLFLVAGLALSNRERASDSDSQFVPAAHEKSRARIASDFSRKSEIRPWLFVAGSAMTVIGAILYFYGIKTISPKGPRQSYLLPLMDNAKSPPNEPGSESL